MLFATIPQDEPVTPPTSISDAMSQNMDSDVHHFDDVELEIAEDCSQFYDDPLGWVLWAFDWGYGDLVGFDGPDTWQRDNYG